MIEKVIEKLPVEFVYLQKQIKERIIRGSIPDPTFIPQFVRFLYHHDVFKKYNDENLRHYKITGIKVSDLITGSIFCYSIYVIGGVLNGYTLEGTKNKKIILGEIDILQFKIDYLYEDNLDPIKELVDESILNLITPSEVYLIELECVNYFHLRDLEDGDFLGIDDKGNFYVFKHDPLGINLIEKEIAIKLLSKK
ncbi:hypothetical protein [Sphingobacterium endophyticum]|uniref:hypothetical protein n=1 Tax=Sphingobacterium endophyticum TaxID=2546448 RepID=UPI0012E28B81|nr:hypothetical protein [Sphingobacterium endophyticum]